MKTLLEKKNILFINSNRNIIDLDPAFQRGQVWSTQKKQAFIDTLIKNWGVPKIYLAAYSDDNHNIYKYECIDGKQRLISIFDFFDNKIAIPLDGKEYYHKELDIRIREKLGKYQFHVEVVKDFNENDLSELFLRLQSGSALNSSEKLKAASGDMSSFVDGLSRHKLFKNKIISKAKRNPHLATMAQVSLLCMSKDIVNLKFKDLILFFKNYSKFNNKSEEAKKIKGILDYIDKNFTEEDANIVFTNRAIFVSCFYLISYLLLRGDIKNIKIKEFFVDFAGKLSSRKAEVDINEFRMAIIQGADSSSSVKKRHNILLKRLVDFDINAKKLVNVQTLEEDFRAKYTEVLKKFSGDHAALNAALIGIGCKSLSVTRQKNVESIPVYIRHATEHPGANRPKIISSEDYLYSLDYLRKIP